YFYMSIYALYLFMAIQMGNVAKSSLTTAPTSTNCGLTYIALGASDSVGVGTSNPSIEGWVPQFALLINAAKTINLGVSGSTVAQALRQQVPTALIQKADENSVITIWLAVNDFNAQVTGQVTLDQYKTSLNRMLSSLKSNTNQVLVGNIPDLSKTKMRSDR
ncbi:unnamed protein product, partial [Didymodactylos carnosus]